eukprot:19411-Rhodomonas_salina.1
MEVVTNTRVPRYPVIPGTRVGSPSKIFYVDNCIDVQFPTKVETEVGSPRSALFNPLPKHSSYGDSGLPGYHLAFICAAATKTFQGSTLEHCLPVGAAHGWESLPGYSSQKISIQMLLSQYVHTAGGANGPKSWSVGNPT